MRNSIPTIRDKRTWNAGVRHLRKDSTMSRIINRVGSIEVDTEWKAWNDHYGSLVRSIVFQQISGSAGNSIMKKFRSLYGNRIPSPERFLSTPMRMVRAAGISPQKYSYLVDLCTRIRDGRLELKRFRVMDDEDVIRELDEVRGIGRWTAEMFLMFSLGRTNVLPRDDLGIQNAIMKAYGLRKRPGERMFSRLYRAWSPYCTIASLYLWESIDQKI